MNNLLIFFALPIATIILAAVLEKLLNSPLTVAAIFFAIYLIVTFAAFDATFLIAAIVYTILAYLTALLVRFIQRIITTCCSNNENNNDDNDDCECNRMERSFVSNNGIIPITNNCRCNLNRRF